MTKASSNELGDLHKIVSNVLAGRLTAPVLTKDGEVVPGTEGFGCTAADITAAISFLKNNNISADAEANEGLTDLKRALEERRKLGKSTLLADQQAASAVFTDRLMDIPE